MTWGAEVIVLPGYLRNEGLQTNVQAPPDRKTVGAAPETLPAEGKSKRKQEEVAR